MNQKQFKELLKKDGWVLEKQTSTGLLDYSHPNKPASIIFRFISDDHVIAPGMLHRLLKKAMLK